MHKRADASVILCVKPRILHCCSASEKEREHRGQVRPKTLSGWAGGFCQTRRPMPELCGIISSQRLAGNARESPASGRHQGSRCRSNRGPVRPCQGRSPGAELEKTLCLSPGRSPRCKQRAPASRRALQNCIVVNQAVPVCLGAVREPSLATDLDSCPAP